MTSRDDFSKNPSHFYFILFFVLLLTACPTTQPVPFSAPTIHPSGGNFYEEVEIYMSTTSNGEIYYTIDGSDPRVSPTAVVYRWEAFTITESVTFNAAVISGNNSSPLTTAVFIIEKDPVISTPVIEPEAGIYIGSVTISVSNEDGSILRYTTDGTAPTADSPLYPGSFTLFDSATVWVRSYNADGENLNGTWSEFTVNPPVEVIDEVFWGRWLGIGGYAYDYYISSDHLIINGVEKEAGSATSENITFTGGTITRVDDDLLKYESDGTDWVERLEYLYRVSSASSDFTATLSDTSPATARALSSRGIEDLAGFQTLIQNLGNPSDTQEILTGNGGSLTAEDVLLGDDYQIIIPAQEGIEQEVSAVVTPLYDGQDLGVVNILNTGANFKMNLNTRLDANFLRADGDSEYDVSVEVTNIGNADLDEANYKIGLLDGLEFAEGGTEKTDILSTVFAGDTRVADLKIICPPISSEWDDKRIEVEVYDGQLSSTWKETLSLRFLKDDGKFEIFIAAEETGTSWWTSDINGLMVDPDGIPARIEEGSQIFNRKPGTWTVVLGGTDEDIDYSFGIDVPAPNAFDEYDGSDLFEPNDSRETAGATAPGCTVTATLGVGDLDFYTFNFAETNTLIYLAPDTDGGEAPSSSSYNYGETVTLAGNPGGMILDDYIFAGWAPEPNGIDDFSGSSLPSELRILSGETLLYAQWVPRILQFSDWYILRSDGSFWNALNYPAVSYYLTQLETGVDRVRTVDTGGYQGRWAFMLKEDGSLWGLGDPSKGQLGTGDADTELPVWIMNDVEDVFASYNISIILKKDGSLWGCGENTGFFGDPETGTVQNTPVTLTVSGDPVIKAVSVSLSGHSIYILKSDETLWTAGENDQGQLGNGTIEDNYEFTEVMSGVQEVASGTEHALVLKKDGTLWSFGYNGYGELGIDLGSENSPGPVQILSGIKAIFTVGRSSFAVDNTGLLWGFGYNYENLMGAGSGAADRIDTPTTLSGPIDVVEIVRCDKFDTLFYLTSSGELWGSGSNEEGRLFYGSASRVNFPVLVQTGALGVGQDTIITSDGRLITAGENDPEDPYNSLEEQVYPSFREEESE